MTQKRTEDEIQAAHDRLVAILLGEVPNPFELDPAGTKLLQAATDVLCWVLGHEHNEGFATVLRDIDEFHARAGLVLTKRNDQKPN